QPVISAHPRIPQELRELPAMRRVPGLHEIRHQILDHRLLHRLALRERRPRLNLDVRVASKQRALEIEDLPAAVIPADPDGARVRVEVRDELEDLVAEPP